MIAYQILGLNICNDDKVIRDAYLAKIRQYPPERSPDEYKVVRKAYEKIETEQKRIEYFLFGNDQDITPEDYERIFFKIDKQITKETWEQLCQMYREKK